MDGRAPGRLQLYAWYRAQSLLHGLSRRPPDVVGGDDTGRGPYNIYRVASFHETTGFVVDGGKSRNYRLECSRRAPAGAATMASFSEELPWYERRFPRMAQSCHQNLDSQNTCYFMSLDGAPERIRTSDPQIRSLVLYPAELRARIRGFGA